MNCNAYVRVGISSKFLNLVPHIFLCKRTSFIVVKWKMPPPQRIFMIPLEPVNVTILENGSLQMWLVKDNEMRRLSWIIWVGCKCHHKCLYGRSKRRLGNRREGGIKTETEIGVMQNSTEMLVASWSRKRQETDPPESLHREYSPADTLILAQWIWLLFPEL